MSAGGDTSGDLSQVLKVDLYNFEEPQFEQGKYVLTSPRSLEACAQLGVKPVDLLYKPLAEFQEELLPQDIPLRTVYNIYDEHEQDRQKKLHLCRDERRKIIENETNSISKKSFSKYNKSSASIFKTSPLQQGKKIDKGSLQRKRTAWATSIGHKRVTPEELNQRASELHAESQKLRQELLSKTERNSSVSRRGRQPTRKARPASGRRCKSADGRASSASGRLVKSGSVSSLVLPVTHIPARDQKIIELMKSKRQREQAERRAKEQAHRVWAEEQKRQQAAQVATEMERRKLLVELERQKEMRKSQTQPKSERKEDSWLSLRQKSLDLDSTQDWESSYLSQLKMKNLKIVDQREKNLKRKASQEFSVMKMEEDMENMKNLVTERQTDELDQAAIRKALARHEESTRTLLKNKKEREAFEARRQQVESMTDQELEELRLTVEGRLQKAATNHQQMMETRFHNISLSRREQTRRQQQARKSLELQEQQLEAWRASLMQHRKKLENQAERTASMTVQQKARQAQAERLAREKEHSKNIKKVQQEAEAWRMETAESIEVKDRRSQAVQELRDMSYHQSRATAQASQILRDEIRNRYDTQTFDKMLLQAELYAKLDRKGLFSVPSKGV